MPNITKETSAKTDVIEITVLEEISNAAGENMEDTVAFQKTQLNPSHSQKATSKIEELSTHRLEQKKSRCKVSSGLKKPPMTKSDDFLY